MGHEILYCSSCAERILGAEFEKGKALRVGHRVACGKCRPALLAELSPAERAAIETPPTVAAAPAVSRPVVMSGSSTRLKHTKPGATSSTWIPVAAGVGIVMLLLLGALLGRKSPAPAPPAPPSVVHPKPPGTTPPVLVENPRLPGARQALAEARQSSAGTDVDAAYAAWERAVWAADQTPLASEALQGFSLALERRRSAWKAAMDEGERDARAALVRNDPPAARGLLEKLRERHKGPEWESKVADLGRRLERAMQEARPWEALFDGKSTDFLKGGEGGRLVVEGGLLVVKQAEGAIQSRRQFADGELRIRFEISGAGSLYFSVRQGEGGFWQVKWDSSNSISGLEGSIRELHFVMKGAEIRATLEGRDIPGVVVGKPEKGYLQFNCQAATFKIHSLEYRANP